MSVNQNPKFRLKGASGISARQRNAGAGLEISGAEINATIEALTTDDIAEGSNLYFTTERAQDAIGSALTDTATVDFTYNDGAGTISAAVLSAGIDHGGLGGLTDNDHPQYEYFSLMMS